MRRASRALERPIGEPRDDRGEDDEPDDRDDLEGAVRAALGDNAGDRDDREAEDHELVPDTRDDDGEPDRAAAEAPRTQHRE